MTAERQELEARLKELSEAKRAAKNGGDRAALLECSRGIVAATRAISKLPQDNQVDDYQASACCWALHAIATHTGDAVEARTALSQLVRTYRKRIDTPQLWGAGRGQEYGKMLFNLMVLAVYARLKDDNADTAEAWLAKVAAVLVEILELRAATFLDAAAFFKRPVTAEQKANMERKAGKEIRLKEWPSLAEKAFGLLHRCLKANPQIVPSKALVDFLAQHQGRGEWLGFYCALARIRRREFAEAKKYLQQLVAKKRKESWAWMALAEAGGEEHEAAMACYCKALLCPNRDPSIAQGTAVKVRRALARQLLALGREAEAKREIALADGRAAVDLKDQFYREGAAAAETLVFGKPGASVGASGQGEVPFKGVLKIKSGNAFGFVQDVNVGPVFIPPKFAAKLTAGQAVTGWAELREDKKKNRLGYCMVRR